MSFSSSREIVEMTDSHDSESQNLGNIRKQRTERSLKKCSLDNDINKLFEAVEIRTSRIRDGFGKKAMKRVTPCQASGIGMSESPSLKQALRGLCITQASEMAVDKKRISREWPSSPKSTESGALKRLHRAVVTEAGQPLDEGKGNMVNVLFLPEASSSTATDKDRQLSKAESGKKNLKTQNFVKKKFVPKITGLTKSNSQHYKEPIVDKCKELDAVNIIVDKGEISQSSKSSSIGEYSSTTTSNSGESHLSGSSRSGYRPHMSKDLKWEAICSIKKQHGSLGLRHLKLLRKLGGGDIGTVYLSELVGTGCLFAMKVMDKELLIGKQKMVRAQTEKEILEILDHPFLPTLYANFSTSKFSCLVMEYCPGGDLHVLRQKQPMKSFSEPAARFYAAEVLLALEYLHMLGVVYRDLKPENILVREDGHIMLSDFDLSLRCSPNQMLLKSSSSPIIEHQKKLYSSPCTYYSCVNPFCVQPPCFTPLFTSRTRKQKTEQIIPLPQLVVEPTSARSNSFVGTHEYLAPEIVKGEGHGSAVDWWTFGIFLYELLYGKTPFKGSSNEGTLSNVISQPLKFPECPTVSTNAQDLMMKLLRKDPENRVGSAKGATDIKQHPFFEGLNWALIRCETPPEVPKAFDLRNFALDWTFLSKTREELVESEREGEGIVLEMF